VISYTGEQEDQQESTDFLSKAFLVSLLLVFFFLVVEFNSIVSPIIIMFTVLLSLIGVLLGLLITDTPFGIIMTGIGVISLGGIVVRNAIILLDFQVELQKARPQQDGVACTIRNDQTASGISYSRSNHFGPDSSDNRC
jgi:multidrug efflux pump